MLEGERAQRSEAARELKQLEKRAAAARSPALQLASPLPAALAALPSEEADEQRAVLEHRIAKHSVQVSERQSRAKDVVLADAAVRGGILGVRSSDAPQCGWGAPVMTVQDGVRQAVEDGYAAPAELQADQPSRPGSQANPHLGARNKCAATPHMCNERSVCIGVPCRYSRYRRR